MGVWVQIAGLGPTANFLCIGGVPKHFLLQMATPMSLQHLTNNNQKTGPCREHIANIQDALFFDPSMQTKCNTRPAPLLLMKVALCSLNVPWHVADLEVKCM